MVGFDSPEATVDEASRLRAELGIRSFKVKVGRRPVEEDVAVCRALREGLEPDVELYLNGNRGWTAAESADVLRRMAGIGLSRVEELCPADDVLGRRWLVAPCPVPLVAGESATTPAELTRELLAGAATAVSIKTARTGFSDSLRVAHLAEGLGVPAFIGNQIDGEVGTACSLASGASQRSTSRCAAGLSNYLDMEDDLLTEPLTIVDGRMQVRTGPGLGIEIDRAKLRHYRNR